MKKATVILMCVLLGLIILYPAGVILTACFGYTFELISATAFAVTIAELSISIVVLDLIYKNTLQNKTLQVLMAIIAPLSLINAVFYIFTCPRIWVVASVLFSAGCCCYITVKHGKPVSVKIAALVLSGLMVMPVGLISFTALIFGNIGQNTVVQAADSPSGKYYAEVIDSDQGALGGDTLVNVYERGGVNAILFKIEKKPQRVYWGEWGEFENMKIRWKDDHCLIINSVEYVVK